jgi:hypothetical protein
LYAIPEKLSFSQVRKEHFSVPEICQQRQNRSEGKGCQCGAGNQEERKTGENAAGKEKREEEKHTFALSLRMGRAGICPLLTKEGVGGG